MITVVTKVSEYSQLVKGSLYTNSEDVRKLVYTDDVKLGDLMQVQWRGKQHKGNGGASCKAETFKQWVNTKPKDLPQVVYSNAIRSRMGMAFTEQPYQCIWNEYVKGWCSLDGEHTADVLGLLQHDGVCVFTSVNEQEVIAWMNGVKSAVAALKSYCNRNSFWGSSLPIHT